MAIKISNTTVIDNSRNLVNTSVDATRVNSGVLSTSRLGTGTASSSTWLRGDGTWQSSSSFGLFTYIGEVTRIQQSYNSNYYPWNIEVAPEFTLQRPDSAILHKLQSLNYYWFTGSGASEVSPGPIRTSVENVSNNSGNRLRQQFTATTANQHPDTITIRYYKVNMP
jgi:hypothetical protein